jgi:hypothetical protein
MGSLRYEALVSEGVWVYLQWYRSSASTKAAHAVWSVQVFCLQHGSQLVAA